FAFGRDDGNYRGTIPTKSRTLFSSGIENVLPFFLRDQNALDEPPSRLRARWILKSPMGVAKILARSARVASEQNPKAARSPEPAARQSRGDFSINNAQTKRC